MSGREALGRVLAHIPRNDPGERPPQVGGEFVTRLVLVDAQSAHGFVRRDKGLLELLTDFPLEL